MCASSSPSRSSAPHLPGLAVANTSAPRCRASCTAAIPTPPAAACTSTARPRSQLAEIDQPVVGRQEHDRHRRGLRERPALGDRGRAGAVGHRDRAERAGSAPSPDRPGAKSARRPTSSTTPAPSRTERRPSTRIRGPARPAHRGSSGPRRAPRHAPARPRAAPAPQGRDKREILEACRSRRSPSARPARRGREHGVACPRACKPRCISRLPSRMAELRLIDRQQRWRAPSRRTSLRSVEVDQHEAPGVLGLSAAHQAPALAPAPSLAPRPHAAATACSVTQQQAVLPAKRSSARKAFSSFKCSAAYRLRAGSRSSDVDQSSALPSSTTSAPAAPVSSASRNAQRP